MGHLNADTEYFADLLSVLNIFGAIWAVLIGYGTVLPVPRYTERRNAGEYRPERKMFWNKKDTIFLLIITVLYSVITLTTRKLHGPHLPKKSKSYLI